MLVAAFMATEARVRESRLAIIVIIIIIIIIVFI